MILELVRWVASHLKRRDIYGEDGTLYLSRYRVIGWMPGSAWHWPFSIYLHRFHREDLDTAPHNHPWRWAYSLILNGSYLEVRELGNCAWFRRWSLNRIRETDFHYVAQIRGEVWTLFVVGPKTKTWGFKVPGRGVVPWRERLIERGIKPPY